MMMKILTGLAAGALVLSAGVKTAKATDAETYLQAVADIDAVASDATSTINRLKGIASKAGGSGGLPAQLKAVLLDQLQKSRDAKTEEMDLVYFTASTSISDVNIADALHAYYINKRANMLTQYDGAYTFINNQ